MAKTKNSNNKKKLIKLFQFADLICSLELLNLKGVSNSFSKSEKEFFGSYRDFKKNYFKHIMKKKF